MNNTDMSGTVSEAVLSRFKALAEDTPDPLAAFVYDLEALKNHVNQVMSAVPKGVELYYAIKANSETEILETIAPLVDGFEISSGGEIARIANCSLTKPFVFSGPGKLTSDMESAIRKGVEFIHVESMHELGLLDAAARKLGKTQNILIRINPALPENMQTKLSMAGTATPFGIEEARLPEVIALAENCPNLQLKGFHIHAMSHQTDSRRHQTLIDFYLGKWPEWKSLARDPGTLTHLNVGGGIGVNYTEAGQFDWTGFCRHLEDSLRKTENPPQIRLEPGRFITAFCGYYGIEVLDIKESHARRFLVCRGGTHQFRLPAAQNHNHPVLHFPDALSRTGNGAAQSGIFDIAGQLCTPKDVLSRDRELENVKVGSLLVLPMAGAYGFNISHVDFLCHPKPLIDFIPAGPKSQTTGTAHTTRDYTAIEVSNTDLLQQQAIRESSARTYPRRFPLAIRHARGLTVTDMDGKEYIDCLAGAGTLALGHNHNVVTDAIREMIDANVPLHTLDITTATKEAFIDELLVCLPATFSRDARVHFCGPTGADGVEAAIKLAKIATGRSTILSFQGGYHGSTHATMSLSGNLHQKGALEGLVPNVHFMPYPYDYRCPFGLGGRAGEKAGLNFIRSVLGDPESGVTKPAAIILEAVQGEGGAIPAPDDWLKELRQLTLEHDVLLIIDEVQTGFGRTGKLFAFEHSGITPDIVVMSKAVGGGLPLSVIAYHRKYDKWQPGAHIGTFRGNQLAMAAGRNTLRYIRENDLAGHAAAIGQQLESALRNLQTAFPQIGDVRGRGLMLGVEMIEDRTSDIQGYPKADPALARSVQKSCFDRGLILEVGGRHSAVLRFLPPLIISNAEMLKVIEIFSDAITENCAQRTLNVAE
ncbi:diaminobutyrate--2-oxoglutarate transaminase [Thalassospira sp. A3_1]|nr:diaminobutyrate--2-oxoglutarate transaminase [Thalassospira sp. A3_1]MBO9509809.1 diaminobutyrate--2-oxoglutarate transaminase [Thalassospira sp. A3_1]